MKTELQQYAASFEAELVAFRDLSTSEFVSKIIGENWVADLDAQYDLITDYFAK